MSLARALKILLSVAATAATLGCHDSTAPATLTVSAVSPDVGPVLGGTSVTIIGVNFIDVTSVTIGGMELTGRTVVGTTQIAGTTPVGDAFGPADIIVTSSSHGSGTCSGCFSYVPGVSPQTIAAGIWHTCGLTTRGTAYCWATTPSASSATARAGGAQRLSPFPGVSASAHSPRMAHHRLPGRPRSS